MALLKFDEQHKQFRQTVRQFIDEEIRPYVEQWEEEGKTPRAVWKKCGELGFLGITFPEEYGGVPADYTYRYIFSEELGGCGSPGVAMGIVVQTDMATPAIAMHGSDFLKKTYLAPALAGDMICSIAVTEPGCGSDVAALKTKAVRDGDDYVINGRKMFITNGSQADFLTLLARTSDEPGHKAFSLFVVPTKISGVSVSKPFKKICFPSSDTVEIALDDVRISKDHLIGKEGMGFMYQMEQFQFERLAGMSTALGAMKRSYKLTKKYATEREVFGRPLFKMQVIRHKLAQILSEITLLESMLHRCVEMANNKQDFTKEVSMLKLVGAQIQQRMLEECVQIHGGYGLMAEFEISRYFRDAKLVSIGGGTNEIMKEIIAKMEGLS